MTIKFTRAWSMPNLETFSVPPIGNFVRKYLAESKVSVDPFARNCNWATYTNDLNPATSAQYHLEALDFLKLLRRQGVVADLVVFDPPFSVSQLKECYESIGLKFMQSDVYKTSSWMYERQVVHDILKIGGIVLSFGWNTIGMGKFDYEEVEMLDVVHGANHNDTLCLSERKLYHQTSLFEES